MDPSDFAAMFPRLAALDLPPRPKDQPVDKSIQKADTRTDPKLTERFGKPRAGQAIIWDEANRPVRVEDEPSE